MRSRGKLVVPALDWPRDTRTLIDLVGGTPLVRMRSVESPSRPNVEIYAKLEKQNPGGSVKDRPAAMMLWHGIKTGALRPGKTILESTSGNTGVALAMLAASLGYPVTLTVADNISPELIVALRAFGAELVLTAGKQGSDGALLRAKEMAAARPDQYFVPEQYDNPANYWAHYLTTGPEIWSQTQGRVTHLVAAVGTGGTVMGTGWALRERNPQVRLIAVEPDEAQHGLNGMRHIPSTIRPRIYDEEYLDAVVRISTPGGRQVSYNVAAREGVLLGPSGGAVLAAAQRISMDESRAVIVCVLADGGAPSVWKQETTVESVAL